MSVQNTLPRPAVDKHFWNFGLLERYKALQQTGSYSVLILPETSSTLAATTLPTGEVAFYSSSLGQFRTVTPTKQFQQVPDLADNASVVWKADSAHDIVDVCFLNRTAYLLDKTVRMVWSVRLLSKEIETIALECEPLEEWARVVACETTDPNLNLIFAGPTKSGRFIVRSVGPDPGHLASTVEHALNLSRELTSVSSRFAMCASVKFATFFLWDADRRSLFSHDWKRRDTALVCSLNHPAEIHPREKNPSDLGRASICMYPLDVIDLDHFRVADHDIAKAARSSGYPRYLLFTDPDGSQIWRWIEMGASPIIGRLRDRCDLHPLIGNNHSQFGVTSVVSAEYFFKSSLYTDLLIRGVGHLDVSSEGVLTAVLGNGRAALVARPASAQAAFAKISLAQKEAEGS